MLRNVSEMMLSKTDSKPEMLLLLLHPQGAHEQ